MIHAGGRKFTVLDVVILGAWVPAGQQAGIEFKGPVGIGDLLAKAWVGEAIFFLEVDPIKDSVPNHQPIKRQDGQVTAVVGKLEGFHPGGISKGFNREIRVLIQGKGRGVKHGVA